MNNIVSKIILGFLFAAFFLILSFYTFFSGDKKEINTPEFNISEIWEKTFSWAISDKVSFYTTIYSKNKDYTVEKNTISVGTWVYFIDSRDVFSKIIIKMWTNNVLLNGWGMVYINNNEKYKTIVSFNNKAEIDFINEDINKQWAKIYLYPHMYFSFRPYRFIKEEQVDSLRVSQLGTLKYFNQNFIDFLSQNKIVFIKKDDLNFFKISLKDILDKQKNYSKELNILKNQNFLNIESSDYIEKYFSIFYNDRKKTIYYKNITLKLLIDLLNIWDIKDINKILENLRLIKNINEDEYFKMKEFIKEIFFLVSYDLSDKSDLIQDRYDLLISKVFKINDTRKIKLIKDVDRYNYLWDFTKFLNLSVLNIENKDLSLLDKEYYILFKQNILISNFANLDIEQKYFDILLKWFISYTQNIDENIRIEEKDNFLSNVVSNINLIDQISLSFKKRYFEDERNSQELLLLKNKQWLENIEEIKKSIEIIFNKYLKAKKYLEEKPSLYNKYIIKYEKFRNNLKEYTDALYNYSLYTKKYSKVNKIISDIQVYEDDDESLSKDKFISFINNFYWINLSTIDLIVEQDYYKINNISINGYDFSFDLFPYSWNIIQNIVYKNNWMYVNARERWFYNQLESTSYDLDNEKEKYEELYKKAKNEDKNKFNFKNFFINTFFISNDKNIEEYNWDKENTNNDDEIIQTFKNAKLLWNKWEFRNIRNLLDIKYSNLDVERKTWKIFIIQINDANINLDIDVNWKKVKYWAIFNSDYKLEDDKHYFYNISMNPYIKKSSTDEKYIFPWVNFKFRWKIDLSEFKEKINEIFLKIPEIKKQYLELSNSQKITSISYNLITWKYYFK